MKYYIIDDEIGTVKTLENIIESRNQGEVVGYSTDPETAEEEILTLNPEIVLVDYLMPKLDGASLVSKMRKKRDSLKFVMISRVTDKSMVEQAYNAGIEFFINKPINIIEVEKVLGNVADKIKVDNLMKNIKGMFQETETESKEPSRKRDHLQEIRNFLGYLGMLGEKGTTDILNVCQFLMEREENAYGKEALMELAQKIEENPKNLEQRMRRAMKKGLTNVANLGIDDYGNEVFQVYANYVFDFKSVKDEMDCIRGLNSYGGRVNISKFIEGLLLYRNSME